MGRVPGSASAFLSGRLEVVRFSGSGCGRTIHLHVRKFGRHPLNLTGGGQIRPKQESRRRGPHPFFPSRAHSFRFRPLSFQKIITNLRPPPAARKEHKQMPPTYRDRRHPAAAESKNPVSPTGRRMSPTEASRRMTLTDPHIPAADPALAPSRSPLVAADVRWIGWRAGNR